MAEAITRLHSLTPNGQLLLSVLRTRKTYRTPKNAETEPNTTVVRILSRVIMPGISCRNHRSRPDHIRNIIPDTVMTASTRSRAEYINRYFMRDGVIFVSIVPLAHECCNRAITLTEIAESPGLLV